MDEMEQAKEAMLKLVDLETYDALMEIYQEYSKRFFHSVYRSKRAAFAELNKKARPGGIVFAGDSITEAFPIHELLRDGPPMYNRGIGGITSGILLEYIDEQILQLKPAKVFLLIGTNDIGTYVPIEDAAGRIGQICSRVAAALPDCKIYVESVYPVNVAVAPSNVGARTNELITRLNALIRREIENIRGAAYIDVYPGLADGNGDLAAPYTDDGLHLNLAGYIKLISLLEPYVSATSAWFRI